MRGGWSAESNWHAIRDVREDQGGQERAIAAFKKALAEVLTLMNSADDTGSWPPRRLLITHATALASRKGNSRQVIPLNITPLQ